ncbi:MAG: hypothetical protein M3Y22_02730, partial [Pseudomonadota bacterium]|nr:hypothetical protein [Pseudomonadota bacterium]
MRAKVLILADSRVFDVVDRWCASLLSVLPGLGEPDRRACGHRRSLKSVVEVQGLSGRTGGLRQSNLNERAKCLTTAT